MRSPSGTQETQAYVVVSQAGPPEEPVQSASVEQIREVLGEQVVPDAHGDGLQQSEVQSAATSAVSPTGTQGTQVCVVVSQAGPLDEPVQSASVEQNPITAGPHVVPDVHGLGLQQLMAQSSRSSTVCPSGTHETQVRVVVSHARPPDEPQQFESLVQHP